MFPCQPCSVGLGAVWRLERGSSTKGIFWALDHQSDTQEFWPSIRMGAEALAGANQMLGYLFGLQLASHRLIQPNRTQLIITCITQLRN